MAASRVSRKRIVIAAAIVFGGAIVWATGLPGFMATLFYGGIYQSLFPSSVSWDSHGAFVKCAGAIKDGALWPPTPNAACEAMHMCANEAALSDSQHRALAATIRGRPGCPPL